MLATETGVANLFHCSLMGLQHSHELFLIWINGTVQASILAPACTLADNSATMLQPFQAKCPAVARDPARSYSDGSRMDVRFRPIADTAHCSNSCQLCAQAWPLRSFSTLPNQSLERLDRMANNRAGASRDQNHRSMRHLTVSGHPSKFPETIIGLVARDLATAESRLGICDPEYRKFRPAHW